AADSLSGEMVAAEAGPALERVAVPRVPADVLVVEVVAVREDVEPGAILVAEQGGERIRELLAEHHLLHAGRQRPPSQARGKPPWTRPRAGDGRGQDEIPRGCEHGRASPQSTGLRRPPVWVSNAVAAQAVAA